MRRGPHQLALPLPPIPTSLTTMSCSNLRDAVPFQFLLGHVAGETISPWDHRKFPCAQANSMVAYPTDTEVRRSILPCGRLITLTIDRFDDDPRVHLPWMGKWIPGGQMEERPVGELSQHGRPLGVHDPSGGAVSNVGSCRVKRSSPLAVAKGLELNGNGFWHRY